MYGPDHTAAVSQRFPKLFDMAVHDPLISFKIISPEPDQQLFPAVDPTWIFQQKQKNLVFLRRQRYRLSGLQDLMASDIDFQLSRFSSA